MTRRWRQKAAVIAVVAIALIAVVIFAPMAVGGKNAYLVTSGVSMLPDIERGDLAITREADEYRVGDVVAYRHPQIGAVLHRIIKEERGHFVLQGDNNDFIDPYRPEESEIMGRLWIHLPGVGSWLTKARQPRNAAMLAVAGEIAAPVGASQARQSRRRQGRGSQSGPPPGRPPYGGRGLTIGPGGQVMAVVVGVIALVSVALAVIAFNSPIERTASIPLEYEQHGTFSYSAEMSGTVYPDGEATSGEPVYRQLTDEIEVRFDYSLMSDAVAGAGGVYRLDAVIEQNDGWSRTLPIVPSTQFEGTQAQVRGVLDLEAIQSEIDSARKQTGLDGQPLRSYTVRLAPAVDLEGTLGTTEVRETFESELQFVVEPLLVKVATSRDAAEASPYSTMTSGTAYESRRVPNLISLPGYELDVEWARLLAQLGLALSIVGGLALIMVVAVSSNADEPARIRARYGSLLISLRGVALGGDVRLIDVESIEDLVRVAEREGRMVLHKDSGSFHQYFVQDVDVTYRYRTQPEGVIRKRPGVERAL